MQHVVGSSWYLTGEASAEWVTVLDSLGGTDNFYSDLRLIRGTDMEVVIPTTGELQGGGPGQKHEICIHLPQAEGCCACCSDKRLPT